MSDQERGCLLCGADLTGRDPRTVTCSPAHRRELSRIRRLVSGIPDGPYRTLGEYLSRARKVRANRSAGT
jgi:hypothetical protein